MATEPRQAPRSLRRRNSAVPTDVVTEMLARVVPGEKPDSNENPDVPRLDVCAFNSSI